MKANGKYVRNDESNVRTKFHEYQSNFIPTTACHALGSPLASLQPDQYRTLQFSPVMTCVPEFSSVQKTLKKCNGLGE